MKANREPTAGESKECFPWSTSEPAAADLTIEPNCWANTAVMAATEAASIANPVSAICSPATANTKLSLPFLSHAVAYRQRVRSIQFGPSGLVLHIASSHYHTTMRHAVTQPHTYCCCHTRRRVWQPKQLPAGAHHCTEGRKGAAQLWTVGASASTGIEVKCTPARYCNTLQGPGAARGTHQRA